MTRTVIVAIAVLYLSASSQIPTVPSGHPRVYVRSGDIAAIRQKTSLTEFEDAWSAVRSSQAPLAQAFRYLLDGQGATGDSAVDSALTELQACTDARSPYNAMHLGACVYDWCYDRLSAQQRTDFITEFIRIADSHSPNYPAQYNTGALVGHNTEGWVMSDQLPAGIAIYDESPTMYDSAAALFFGKFVEARDFYARSHMHHQGDSYIGTRYQHDILCAWLFRRMAGADVYSSDMHYVPYQIVYNLRPDGQQMRSGDTYDDRGRSGAKRRIALWAACYYDDPCLLTLADSDIFWSSSDVDRIFELLFRPADAPSAPLSDLPLTKYFADPMGEMVVRTGWDHDFDNDNTVVQMRIGGYFFGNHQRKDFGSFQIYHRGALAIASGLYEGDGDSYGSEHWTNYHHQTVSQNSLLIYDPSETMPRGAVNDGGQWWPNDGSDHPRDLSVLLDTANGYRMGQVTAHAFGPDSMAPAYSYIAGDITTAYNPSKVDLVTRSMVTLCADGSAFAVSLVIHDRVRSTDASYRKTWLLHSLEEPSVTGRDIRIANTGPEYRGRGNYQGMLHVKSLLPAPVDIQTVGGPGREFWVESAQTNYFVTKNAPAEAGAWRVEISPSQPALEDEFLTVLTVADAAVSAVPDVAVVSGDSLTGVRVMRQMVVFSRLAAQPGSVLTFSVSVDSGEAGVLVCELTPGQWQVSINGNPRGTAVATPESRSVYFEAPAGTVELEYSRLHTGGAHRPGHAGPLTMTVTGTGTVRQVALDGLLGSGHLQPRLTVHTLAGARVCALSGHVRPGLDSQRIAWDTSGLARGVYVLRLSVGRRLQAVPVVLYR